MNELFLRPHHDWHMKVLSQRSGDPTKTKKYPPFFREKNLTTLVWRLNCGGGVNL